MSSETFNHEQWETGSEPQTTTEGVVAVNQILAKYTPLGVKLSTGEFHKWDPAAEDGTQVAVRITPFNIDTTGAVKTQQLIKAGTFNPELISWHEGVTDAQKLAAFVGSPISLQALR
ncbi:head decoration protein [Gammaproteobacteria bacterium AS21]